MQKYENIKSLTLHRGETIVRCSLYISLPLKWKLKKEKNEWWFKKNTAYVDILDYIYLPKRLGHKILVFNFQAWDISDIVSAMQRLEFPCLKYQSPR